MSNIPHYQFQEPSRSGHPQRNGPADLRNAATNGSLAGPPSSNGSVPVSSGRPVANGNAYNNHSHRHSAGPGAFNTSRSPPSNKNTSHVPCKFFLQGNCQAGSACPFKHSADGPQQVEVCKYFMKGNCKYGRKCLLEHVGPDGTRFPNQMSGHFNHAQPGTRNQSMDLPRTQYPSMPTAVPSNQHGLAFQGKENIPAVRPFDNQHISDQNFPSYPGSAYGSPQQDTMLAMSPSMHPQRALDAPFPSSFDSQAMSNYAAFGKTGTSVPSRFGFHPLTATSPTTSTVQSQAFGNLDNITRSDARIGSNPMSQFGSSPPTTSTAESQPRRIMHFERRSNPQMISSSLPVRDRIGGNADDDVPSDIDTYQEDLLPGSLTDLMTPQEKMRRFSRNDEDGSAGSFRQQSLSGLGSPGDSKVGSPSQSSPSRYSALFMKQQQAQQQQQQQQQNNDFVGHVGSPLRNSLLSMSGTALKGSTNSPNVGPISRPSRSGDVSPHLSSPPRSSSGGMGMLSLQLQRTRLQEANASNPNNANTSNALPTSSNRGVSNPSMATTLMSDFGNTGNARQRYDRAISSGSVRADRIDEEPCVFSMDEEELKAQQQNQGSTSDSPTTATGAKNPSEAARPRGVIGGEKTKTNGN